MLSWVKRPFEKHEKADVYNQAAAELSSEIYNILI
jgi:hypothetical protein